MFKGLKVASLSPQSVIRKVAKPLVLTVVLILSGFFVANNNIVLAAHTTSVSYLIDDNPGAFVSQGGLHLYDFAVTNNGTDKIYKITVNIPSGSGFSIDTSSIFCPQGWGISPTDLSTTSKAVCATEANPTNTYLLGASLFKNISFSANSPSNLTADAAYEWAIETADNFWGHSSTNSQITVDVIAPTTTDNASDTSLWHKGSVSINLISNDGAIGSGVASTQYCVGAENCTPNTLYVSGTPVLVTSEGINYVRYFSTDNVGNIETVKTAGPVKIDNTKPVTTATFGSPRYGVTSLIYITSSTSISLSAIDGGSGMTGGSTHYSIDSGVSTTYSAPFVLGEGEAHSIAFGSVDAIGNQEESQTILVFVDDTSPTVGEITVTPSYVNGTTKYISGLSTISATVTDGDGSGVMGCEYTIDGGLNWTQIFGGTCSVLGVNTSAATSINIKAIDNVGNVGNGATVAVTPDVTAPVTTDSGTDTNWHKGDVTVTLSPTDAAGSGVDSTQYCVGANCTPNTLYVSSTPISVISEGINYVRYSSTDNVENVENIKPATHTVKIDKTAPVIADIFVDYPGEQTKAKNGDIITITANVIDGVSGVNTVTLGATSIDGASNITMIKGVGDIYSAQVTISGTTIDSSKTITITAQDIASNTATQDGEVVIDNTKPEISSYTLNGNASSVAFNPTKESVNIVNIAVNANEDVKFNRISILDSDNTEVGFFTENTSFVPTATKSWNGKNVGDIDTVPDGDYKIKVTIADTAGNIAEIPLSPYTMTVDTVAPVVVVTSLQKNKVVAGDLTINTTGVSGAVSCAYKFSNETEQPVGCNVPSISTIGLEGRRTLTFYGRDNAKNESSAAINFIANNDKKLTVGNEGDFVAIQEAIDNSQADDTVFIKNGHYDLTATLNLTKQLTIEGENRENVIIDASAVSGYGITNTNGVDNLILKDFTLLGPTADVNSSYGIKAAYTDDLTIEKVTVSGSGRSEVDLNTVNRANLRNITAGGTETKGVGIALSASTNITLESITTIGNAWGGVALYDTSSGTTSNVSFIGTHNLGEENSIYIDAEYNNPITNITLPINYHYAVRNTAFRPEGSVRSDDFTFFQTTKEKAVVYASALQAGSNKASYIQTLGVQAVLENNFVVGNGMAIQTAITAAASGATINVEPGNYAETGQIVIDKNLTITGVTGANKPVITPSADLPATNNAAGAWFLITADKTFSLKDVVLNGNGKRVYQGIRSHGNTTIDRVDFINIRDSAAPYVGFAVANFGGIVPGGAGSDTHSGSGGANSALTVANSTFSQIGRIGILVKGTHSTATISGNTYTGKGADTFLDYAFEVGAGGSATITGNNVINGNSGTASDGSTSAGILVTDYYGTGTHAVIIGNTISNSTDGIAVGYDEDDESVVVVHNNKFSENEKNINSTHPVIDAINNWYGTTDGTIIAPKMSNYVNYRPWCVEQTCATIDNTAPTIDEGSITPSGDSVGIALDASISASFSEKVMIKGANIELKKGDAIIPLDDSQVVFNDTTKTVSITVEFSSNEIYTVTLADIEDMAGNGMSDYSWKFTTATGYNISLQTGWNLMSLPVTPTTWKNIGDVLTGIRTNTKRVWTYDAVAKKWLVYNTNPAIPSDEEFTTMEAGHGYWIDMISPANLTGSGTLYEQLVPSGNAPSSNLPQLQLTEGWNLIGYYQLPGKINSPISNALSKLTGAWSGVNSNGYASDLLTFTPTTLHPRTLLNAMVPGEGYWIYMGSAKMYSFGNADFN